MSNEIYVLCESMGDFGANTGIIYINSTLAIVIPLKVKNNRFFPFSENAAFERSSARITTIANTIVGPIDPLEL